MSSPTTPRKQYEAEITYPGAVAIIDIILRAALSQTIDDLDDWIDEHVPKRTGQLRESLKRNLRSSRVVHKTLLKLYFGTHLDYAEFVNNMTTSQVAHSNDTGYAYYYGHYGRITLNDPNAVGNFFDEMIKFARLDLASNVQSAIRTTINIPRSIQHMLINYTVVRRT